ncbi:MAG: amino acid ABC transporter ATP-binding protein [Cellulosilyticaceae bacterium]
MRGEKVNKESLLEVKGLSKSFGENKVFEKINFSLHEGEVIVVLGPSGCGKSTLLRCLNGLEVPNEGEIILKSEGVLGKDISWQKTREKIGMVFQSYDLFPHMTVIDNVLLGPVKVQKRNKSDVKAEVQRLLERVGLGNRLKDYPRQLSGGQKQRIAIVRALAMKPSIMLFDEVTAALDPEMVKEVLDVILELRAEGKTMMIVTHELGFAKAVSDRVIFMEGCQIVEMTPSDTFFQSPQSERAKQFLDHLLY